MSLRSAVSVPADAPRAVTEEAVLAAIERRHHVSLAAAGTVTSAQPVMVEIELPDGVTINQDRTIAAYVGRTEWTGRWSYRWCADHFWHSVGGAWRSFEATRVTGSAVCMVGLTKRRSAYAKNPWARLACHDDWAG